MERNSSLPDLPALSSHYPGFSSYKTAAPIHYRRRWYREALIQATLDPEIIELAPSITPELELPPPIEFSFRIRRLDGMGLVLLSRVPTNLQAKINDSRIYVVERADLLRGPKALASSAIWAQKRLSVDPGDRYRAIEHVAAHGGEAPLSEIITVLRNKDLDPVRQVLSFLAAGVLTCNLDRGIGPRTAIAIGPSAYSG